MTPDQIVANKKRLVSAARAFLSLQVGLGIGCIRTSKLLSHLDSHVPGQPQIFAQAQWATVSLPIGPERLLWAHGALLEKDTALTLIEQQFRPEIMKACSVLIEAYG